jgi:SWI/SNF-related matrix-associated actin-dependent regulator of chromatin subfamily A member 5
MQLAEKERLWNLRQDNFVVSKMDSKEKMDDTQLEELRRAEQEKIDNGTSKIVELISKTAPEFTEEDTAEKNSLFKKGFGRWNTRDFKAFIRASEKYGRNNIEAIAKEIGADVADAEDEASETEEKVAGQFKFDLDEVKRYADKFWKNYKELKEGEKFVQQIVRGEKDLDKQKDVQKWLTDSVASVRYPTQELDISFMPRAKGFTDEEDRFMLVRLQHYGYGDEEAYEKIRLDMRSAPQFRFDWFIKSRTVLEIRNRIKALVKSVEGKTFESDGSAKKRARK